MKLVTFRTASGETHAGALTDAGVVPLQAAGKAAGVEIPDSVVAILASGNLPAVQKLLAGNPSTIETGSVQLLAAVPDPPTVYLLAANYQSHITESGSAPVDKNRITPRPFIKPGTAVIGDGDAIPIPPDSDTLDYEIEIAAVIGTAGKHVSVEAANDLVAGYVVFNDVSARSLKISEGRAERNGDWFFDWLLGKWCDGFAVVGPHLVTTDEVGDPRGLEMALKVNGELRQHSDAGEMIFSIPEAIAFLSRFVTLRPGDLLCMGTPGGVGVTTNTYLQPGDVVEASIEHLGSITNTVTSGT